jgi:hypothetical protein
LSHFKKSHFKRSLHYENISEVPVFNLCKLHGSLSWELQSKGIAFSPSLAHVTKVAAKAAAATQVVDVPNAADLPTLISMTNGHALESETVAFIEAYESFLVVVNPTKQKFKHTILNQTYYELLRLFSNELEKENCLLLVAGFSFADEHIREIMLRAANSNPTLIVRVLAHTSEAAAEISVRLDAVNASNRNIQVLAPEQDGGPGSPVDKFRYDLKTINELILQPLLKSVVDA